MLAMPSSDGGMGPKIKNHSTASKWDLHQHRQRQTQSCTHTLHRAFRKWGVVGFVVMFVVLNVWLWNTAHFVHFMYTAVHPTPPPPQVTGPPQRAHQTRSTAGDYDQRRQRPSGFDVEDTSGANIERNIIRAKDNMEEQTHHGGGEEEARNGADVDQEEERRGEQFLPAHKRSLNDRKERERALIRCKIFMIRYHIRRSARATSTSLTVANVAAKQVPRFNADGEEAQRLENVWKALRCERLAELKEDFKDDLTRCQFLASHFHVRRDRSWGELPPELQAIYAQRECDVVIHYGADGGSEAVKEIEKKVLANYEQIVVGQSEARTPSQRLSRSRDESTVVAILFGTTSNQYEHQNLTTPDDILKTSMCVSLLPSFVEHADVGFEYWIYVAHDRGDVFFEGERAKSVLRACLQTAEDGCASRGIVCRTVVLSFENEWRKPGPVFNFVAKSAFDDGVDYLFRINDDSMFIEPLIASMVSFLQSLKPAPNVGVAGPLAVTNRRFLTHDFVHRTHMEIHPFYYPPELADWWMDNWITQVYPKHRVGKIGMIEHQGKAMRYIVSTGEEVMFPPLHRGQALVKEYLGPFADEEKNAADAFQAEEEAMMSRLKREREEYMAKQGSA